MRAKEFINENVPATGTDTERAEAQTAYMQGQCMILAIAINQLNPERYPIGYIWEYNADAGVPDIQLDDDEWENLSPQEQEEISKNISRHSIVHAYVRDRETNEYIDARGRHRDIPNLWGRLGVTRFEEFPGTARELIDITVNGEWDEVGEQVNFKRGQPAFDSLAGPAGVKRAQDYAVKYLNIDPGPATPKTPNRMEPSSGSGGWVILGPYKNVLYRFHAPNEQYARPMKDQWCQENNVDPGSCRLKYDGNFSLGQPRNMAAATTNDGITNAAYLYGLRHGREGAGDNMDRARAEWGDDFKYYNAGFLKGRNKKAQSLKAVGQGYGNKEQGVAESNLNEYRDQLWTWVQSKFPRTQWPEYVQRDFLYAKAKGNKNRKDLEDFLDEIQRDFGNCKWTLTKIPITLDIFTPKTQRMIQSREGGSSNPFQVPKDAERHAQQSQMIQQKGVSAEPIIVAKLANGYDLIEGWHRTIQHLKAFPQGYTGPAWVCTGATYKSESVEQGVAEGLRVDVPTEEWLNDAIAYAKKRGPNSFGVPYMGKTTATVRQIEVPVWLLRRIPGMRNEQQNVRPADLAAIMKIMKDTGKLPLHAHTGEEYKPFINVAYDGSTWVNEGNHRIMAANRLGFETLPVEISYFDGGERVKSGPMYPGKIGL